MAKMHSRKKGVSGSKKPIKKAIPSWSRYKPKEIEILISKLAKEGKSSSHIGLVMRDVYGVPDVEVACGKRLGKILAEKSLLPDIPEDLMSLLKKLILIKKHLAVNKKDMPAKRGLQLTQSKILRLVKYYKRTKRLPADWSYDEKNISLIVE